MVFANAAHLVEGRKSWWLTWESRHIAHMDIFSLHSISSFTFRSQSFFCMIEWTFVRIIYHYMGLQFLCMLGSLRITGRLLHISKTPVPDLPLSFPSGSFLVRCWTSTVLTASQRINFHISALVKTVVHVHVETTSSYSSQTKCILSMHFFYTN